MNSCSHADTATCAHTQPRALCVLASVSQWDVFFKDATKFTLLICILLYSLIPCVMVYCWSIFCSYLSCTFSKCSTFDLSLLISDHIFHFSEAFGSLSFEVLLVSTSILLSADFKNSYLESLGLLWKYQIETD